VPDRQEGSEHPENGCRKRVRITVNGTGQGRVDKKNVFSNILPASDLCFVFLVLSREPQQLT
jgi:hypothetical protein